MIVSVKNRDQLHVHPIPVSFVVGLFVLVFAGTAAGKNAAGRSVGVPAAAESPKGSLTVAAAAQVAVVAAAAEAERLHVVANAVAASQVDSSVSVAARPGPFARGATTAAAQRCLAEESPYPPAKRRPAPLQRDEVLHHAAGLPEESAEGRVYA